LGGVDERKKADEPITALIEKFAESYFRDPKGIAVLYAYPHEVNVRRGDGGSEPEVVKNAHELVACYVSI
jgi:hypothetical protein